MAKQYTVINKDGVYLAADNLLLLPAWTSDLRKMWLTNNREEALRVAHQVEGIACSLNLTPILFEQANKRRRGVPIAVQSQAISLHEQGLSYRQIGKLLNIAKSSVGNILNRN